MGGTFNKGKVWSNADNLTATDLNTKTATFISHFAVEGIDDASVSDTAARATKDPYPSGISYSASLAEEIKSIRFQIDLIIGGTYWYEDIQIAVPTTYVWLTCNTSTKTFCFQNTAPTGWTIAADCGDGLCAVKSASGEWGYSGGSKLKGSWQHYHADRAHQLTEAEMAAHYHSIYEEDWAVKEGDFRGYITYFSGLSGEGAAPTDTVGGGGSHTHPDTLGAKVSGGSADAWRPIANIGIIITRS